MDSIIIKQAILLDGSCSAKTFRWNEKKIAQEETSMKNFFIKKYGKEAIADDFKFVVYSYTLGEKAEYTKITNCSIEHIDWFHSLLKKEGVLKEVTDEQGNFLDGTVILCDVFWKNLDANSEMKIIDCIFEKAKENEKVIFVPYYQNCFNEMQKFHQRHLNDYSCKLTKSISFNPSDLSTLDSKLFLTQNCVFKDGLLELEEQEKTIKG